MDSMFIIVACPHCDEFVLIHKNEINCKIFRHGVYRNTLKQINPHLDKASCDILFEKEKIFGCGKPFCLEYTHKVWEAKKCDYI